MKKTPADLIARAGQCASASAAMTVAARQLEAALTYAAAANCTPVVADAIEHAQRAISTAQGATESRRRRLLRKADRLSKEPVHD